MFRKYVATTLVNSSYNSITINQLKIDNEAEFRSLDIHRIFYKTIYITAMYALDHLIFIILYYVDPHLIISICNKIMFIKDLN